MCGVKLKNTIYGVILFVTALVNFANIRHDNNQIVNNDFKKGDPAEIF